MSDEHVKQITDAIDELTRQAAFIAEGLAIRNVLLEESNEMARKRADVDQLILEASQRIEAKRSLPEGWQCEDDGDAVVLTRPDGSLYRVARSA